jgi:hypothetical protein
MTVVETSSGGNMKTAILILTTLVLAAECALSDAHQRIGQLGIASNENVRAQTLSAKPDDANPTVPVSQAECEKRSVKDFLTPDGRFDLAAARASGYQGPLDLDGFDVRIDKKSGSPKIHQTPPRALGDHPDDIYWQEGFHLQGIDGSVFALAIFDGQLIAGGAFQVAGNTIAHNIAAWDGSLWSTLATGINGVVYALTIYNNTLIAAGYFDTAGGVAVNSIAAWDGSSWSPLECGEINGYHVVNALTVYDNKLVAGGFFATAESTEHYISVCDGSTWSRLGSGMNSYVYCLIVYDNKLIAGGAFDTAGGAPANHIAAWTGSTWSPLGSGVGGVDPEAYVCALTVYGTKLIAGGQFTIAGGIGANNIGAWDGATWSSLSSGTSYGPVFALSVYDDMLIAGGWFTMAGAVAASRIATWNGSTWSSLGSGMDGYFYSSGVYALIVYNYKLIAAGRFDMAGSVGANSIAAWDGSNWLPLTWGMNYHVRALTVYDNKLIAGGAFITAGGVGANRIAAWNGFSWLPLGSGISGYVYALAVYDNHLIAGGGFDTAGDVAANNIAAWDSNTWKPLGSGMNGLVEVLTVYENKLVAGGWFDSAGGVSANHIAAWDGFSWLPLTTGTDSTVSALTVYDDKLIAAGNFVTAGDEAANYVAAWNGSTWSPLGSGVSGGYCVVKALTVYDNKLVAGGYFDTAGSAAADRIAAWDGFAWSALGSGLGWNSSGLALTVYDNKLIAGGYFTEAAGAAGNSIAAWDGSSWLPLGSGMGLASYPHPQVFALSVYDNKLIAAGWFTSAGDKASAFIAAWTKHATAVEETPESALPTGFNLSQNYPNPFNPETRIEFSLPHTGQVTIEIYNILGQKVKTLVNERLSAGKKTVTWDGTDDSGALVSSGVYLYRIKPGDFVEAKKMVLLR